MITKISTIDFEDDKSCDIRKIVQVDETMLSYKCKSYRERPRKIKIDSICIIDFDTKIVSDMALIAENKK